MLCYVFQGEVLNSVLIFKGLSARQFLWDQQEATGQSALQEGFLYSCLLRWSSTTASAHPALDNAHLSLLEVFDYSWSNKCDCKFNPSKKKLYRENNYWRTPMFIKKRAEDRTQNQSSLEAIQRRISKFWVTECWSVFNLLRN